VKRRSTLSAIGLILVGGCLSDTESGSASTTSATTETTASGAATADTSNESATNDTSTQATETMQATPNGPIEPADGIETAKQGDDSVGIHLEGYDSDEYSEARFFRATDSDGVPAELSRSQVTSTPQLQNALAYFGPEVEEVSVRMPLSDGYSLSDALDSYWDSADDAERNADGDKVYRFEDVRFTVLIVYYD
jgi:hypothetical protein